MNNIDRRTKKMLLCRSDQFFLLRCFHGTLNMVLLVSIHSRPATRPLSIRFSSHGRKSTRSRRSPATSPSPAVASPGAAQSCIITAAAAAAATASTDSITVDSIIAARHQPDTQTRQIRALNSTSACSYAIRGAPNHDLSTAKSDHRRNMHENRQFSFRLSLYYYSTAHLETVFPVLF